MQTTTEMPTTTQISKAASIPFNDTTFESDAKNSEFFYFNNRQNLTQENFFYNVTNGDNLIFNYFHFFIISLFIFGFAFLILFILYLIKTFFQKKTSIKE